MSMAVGWLAFGVLVYLGLRYRVYWSDDQLCQEASGGPKICIKYSEITKVDYEVAGPSDWRSASRPFRRIATDRLGEKDGYIDVSLRHFAMDDIRELMHAIRTWRPDLSLPPDVI